MSKLFAQSNRISANDNVINTRQKGNIYVERCKTNEEQKMLLHDGFKLYNSLPIEIKNELRL